MSTKPLILIALFLLLSCNDSNQIPKDLKEGLVEFTVNKSDVTQQLETNQTLGLGSLWVGFNKINLIKESKDTLYVKVNVELSKQLNYDGGYEFANDTLFLYVKNLDKQFVKETVHSTLSYTILTKGKAYKGIEFKEIK